MRKYVYVRIQKILMFIPIVNVSILIIYRYNCYILNIPKRTSLKGDLIAMCCSAISWIFLRFLYETFGISYDTIARDIFVFIFVYIIPFTMAYSLVRFQEKLGLE
jgi:hypothetical protein